VNFGSSSAGVVKLSSWKFIGSYPPNDLPKVGRGLETAGSSSKATSVKVSLCGGTNRSISNVLAVLIRPNNSCVLLDDELPAPLRVSVYSFIICAIFSLGIFPSNSSNISSILFCVNSALSLVDTNSLIFSINLYVKYIFKLFSLIIL